MAPTSNAAAVVVCARLLRRTVFSPLRPVARLGRPAEPGWGPPAASSRTGGTDRPATAGERSRVDVEVQHERREARARRSESLRDLRLARERELDHVV